MKLDVLSKILTSQADNVDDATRPGYDAFVHQVIQEATATNQSTDLYDFIVKVDKKQFTLAFKRSFPQKNRKFARKFIGTLK